MDTYQQHEILSSEPPRANSLPEHLSMSRNRIVAKNCKRKMLSPRGFEGFRQNRPGTTGLLPVMRFLVWHTGRRISRPMNRAALAGMCLRWFDVLSKSATVYPRRGRSRSDSCCCFLSVRPGFQTVFWEADSRRLLRLTAQIASTGATT